MSALISCPACGNQGELPPSGLSGDFITCRSCGVRFSPIIPAPMTTPPGLPVAGDDGLGVWVGAGPDAMTESTASITDTIPLTENTALPNLEITPENAAAHLVWLRSETERFRVYVDRQLAALGKMREQVASYEAKTRAETVTREMSLSRERAVLDARAQDLARRETELAEALTRQGDQLAAELGQLVATEREHLARRAEELMSMERSLQVRLNEVEDLEHSLRSELDEREMAVERQRRVLEDVAHELRTRTPPPAGAGKSESTQPQPAFACG